MDRLFIFVAFVSACVSSICAAPVPVAQVNDRSYPFCDGCIHMVEAAKGMIQSNKTFAETRAILIGLCRDWLDIRGEEGHVMCPGLIDSYGPPGIYIISEAWLSPLETCEKIEFCPKSSVHVSKAWATHASHVSPLNHVDYKANDPLQPIRILHLTDIHLDHAYKEGAAVECEMTICCRDGLGMNGSGNAGRYGEYKCDLPIVTADLLMNHLRQLDPQPDFTIYTGDNPPHDVWNETWNGQTESTKFVVDYLSKNLPNQTIYPAMGNHETFPESFYYPPTYGNLTASLADFWQQWVELPDSALQTIRSGGYYTMLIRPGLRLMSINTDYGYQYNLYTLLNDRTAEYFDQREWMKSTLEEAVRNGEKVVIIGHIPPGDPTTIESYGEFYVPLVANYSNVIVGQLFGHIHEDLFQMVQATDGSPAGVVHIAPSVTTYLNVNPSFRIYSMDPNTFHLIDYEQYYLNVTNANILAKQNRTEDIKFKLEYTARQEYDLADLSPNSWWDLTERLSKNSSLLLQYLNNKYSRSDVTRECDSFCKKELICGTRSASKAQLFDCLSLQ
jgi:sphingomyelin phosphodiesterase